jgi:hypothetical protein
MSFDAVNTAATFDPQFETPDGEDHDGSRPCLTVAGVQVYAYVQDDGTLRVSLDFDTADPDVFGEDTDGASLPVPVQVALSGQPVYRIDRDGAEWYGRDAEDDDREIVRHNTEEASAVVVRPGVTIHVFGDVNVITGPHGAAEKLAADVDPATRDPYAYPAGYDTVTDAHGA